MTQTQCECHDDNEVRCENAARYVDEFGQATCGLCPIKYGADALKLDEIGQLITWARETLDGGMMGGSSFERLRAIMGAKKPEAPFLATAEEGCRTNEDGPMVNPSCECCCDVHTYEDCAARKLGQCRVQWPVTCEDTRCEAPRGHEGPHRARSWNAQWGTEEIDEW